RLLLLVSTDHLPGVILLDQLADLLPDSRRYRHDGGRMHSACRPRSSCPGSCPATARALGAEFVVRVLDSRRARLWVRDLADPEALVADPGSRWLARFFESHVLRRGPAGRFDVAVPARAWLSRLAEGESADRS